MLGVDTLSLHLPVEYVSSTTAAALADCLTKEVADTATGAVWQGGHLANLRVSVGESGLNLVGSLPLWLYGQNVQTVCRRDLLQAIERLNTAIGADMGKAEVRRVDVSATLQMRHAPLAYLQLLGAAPHFVRIATAATTVEYRRGKQQTQVLVFYDKAEEVRAKGKGNLPAPYAAVGNCLRCELRLMRQPAKQVGMDSLTLGQLADKDIFRRLVALWKDSYFAISKTYKTTDMAIIKTPKDAVEYLLATLLAEAGGAARVDSFLADLKARSTFCNRQDYTRLKSTLKSLQNKYANRADARENLGRELDEAIYNEVAYF